MNEILRPVEAELEEFERYFGGALYSDVQLIKDIAIHIGRGKRLRPALMFLVARYFGVINEKVYNSALVIELIHTATLLHDDVIDESTERRNKSSINNK